MATKKKAPQAKLYPIIYVRGFAFTADERDQTTADPYCGFNIGSTVYRATADRERPKSYFFESPLVRLASDYGYRVLYRDGLEILDPAYRMGPDGELRLTEGIPLASIVIHRFYDAGSRLKGDGKPESIEHYAAELAQLIAQVRDLVQVQAKKADPSYTDEDFKCYLVAHSMGGLVVRAFLQNAALERPMIDDKPVASVRGCVAKVFTYATPHNGIEVGGINVPGFLGDASNFNRDVMRKYLALEADHEVNFLPQSISPTPENWFCMIGTNRLDYETAAGLSRTFVGRGSDGLVRIENASLWYRERTDAGAVIEKPVACAYTYRAHSGAFGIVNSEEAYQNLTRFLFGNFRIDLWLDIADVTLPADVLAEEKKGRKIDAVYQTELVVATRGKTWALSRRKSEEDSPACRTYQQIKNRTSKVESVHLSTVFLSKLAKVNAKRPGISYSVTLGIRAPDYEVNKAFWADGHYEGVTLFRDSLVVTIFEPAESQTDDPGKKAELKGLPGIWKVHYEWLKIAEDTDIPERERKWTQEFAPEDFDGKALTVEVQLHKDGATAKTGAVAAKLRMVAQAWS
ncbi:esterase/lipase family protein [Variovorax sp. LjRoot290]|uniref:esterase/lipase family protein n=1 Tax=Variovorax sp. LjRoot290 TaxID=3342316 RepID=UPI003F513F60